MVCGEIPDGALFLLLDGGPAISALLAFPQGVVVDSTGNLYVADSGNHRIRVLTPMIGDGTEGTVCAT